MQLVMQYSLEMLSEAGLVQFTVKNKKDGVRLGEMGREGG